MILLLSIFLIYSYKYRKSSLTYPFLYVIIAPMKFKAYEGEYMLYDVIIFCLDSNRRLVSQLKAEEIEEEQVFSLGYHNPSLCKEIVIHCVAESKGSEVASTINEA